MKKPRYTHGFIDRHGKARFYFRRPGFKSIALPGMPWSPTFMAAYEAALSGESKPVDLGASKTKPGTIGALVVAYYNSGQFQGLPADSTKTTYRGIIERFRAE